MKHPTDSSRRTFLVGSAMTAAVALLGGCAGDGGGGAKQAGGPPAGGKVKAPVGSETKALTPPAKFREAPMLTKLVEAGTLPPVEQRLPTKPYVVPHRWVKAGNYGGWLRMSTPDTANGQIRQYMYGHSPLRWLNDGMDIGPGLVESWESNDDASQWTLHFREGLRWSDGKPWTTADIMFWWEDLVLNEAHSAVPPDEMRSGKGTLAKVTASDDFTLVLDYDAPAPLTADRLAMWVKGGNGDNGPIWMLPKHFAQQFHPKYNPKVGENWATAGGPFELNTDFARNPRCPTMTGWRLTAYREGQFLQWERNPYYWCVDREGGQLPYVDRLVMNAVKDPEVGKLQLQQGKFDYVHGPYASLSLADVSGLKSTSARSGMNVYLWDGGDGTGPTGFFFNYDYKDPAMRALIREPRFRQALSLAFNRAEVQKSVHFGTGELTTGTMSPKAIEYHVNAEGRKVYQQWRDSFVGPDPEQAKKLLDELGVVDKDGDGKRERPDGTKLALILTHAADAGQVTQQTNNLMRRDWEAIGLDVRLDPIPPESLGPRWESGDLMTRADWGVGDGPNYLVYPQWVVPMEPSRWAPLEGQFYNVRGTPAEHTQRDIDPFRRTPPRMEPEKGGPIEKLWQIYDRSKVEPDELKRHQLAWELTKVHIEFGPFFQGSVANTPTLTVAHKDLRNVPVRENLAMGGFSQPWIHPTPAVYDPETYFWANPERHTG
jgi:peptide/nickel transport system substrate-binding protein